MKPTNQQMKGVDRDKIDKSTQLRVDRDETYKPINERG